MSWFLPLYPTYGDSWFLIIKLTLIIRKILPRDYTLQNRTIGVNLRKSYALNPSGPVGSVLRRTRPNAICIPNRTGTSAKTRRCAYLRK